MRWTRRWRTTSAPPKRTNSTPSTSRRMSATTTSPDRRAREDDPVHLVPAQRRGRHRHREERLARARRADPERDRVAADRVDVALLVYRLRGGLRRAGAPDDV